MWGKLSEEMKAVTCRIQPDQIELHFYADGDVTEDVETISDDLEGYLATDSINIVSMIHDVSTVKYHDDYSDRTLRRVYLAKLKL